VTKHVVIDPGHGGTESGAVAVNGVLEKNPMLSIGLALRDILTTDYDCAVTMTRETDVNVNLGHRAQIANRAKADLLVSLHHDSGPPSARGGSCYVHTNKRSPSGGLAWLPAVGSNGVVNHEAPNSYRIAAEVIKPVRAELARYGIPWRSMGDGNGIMCADFWVLDQCWGSCLLLEYYFGSNEHDNWAATRGTFVTDIAKATATGIATALDLPRRHKQDTWIKPTVKVVLPSGRVLWGVLRDAKTFVTLPGTDNMVPLLPVAEFMGRRVTWTEIPPTVVVE